MHINSLCFMLDKFKITKSYKKRAVILRLIIGLVLSAIFLINLAVNLKTKQYIFSEIEKVPKTEVALILGAKVFTDGRLSDMLRDRADMAIELYKSGKVSKILMSGDHGTKEYDEVNAVKKYLLEKGISGNDIFLDYAGFDTYDSMYRAKEIFQAQSVSIISQNFHLPRAVYIGRSLGLEAYGISADTHVYGGIENNRNREILANIKAFWDVNLLVKSKFLGELIPLSGDSKKSWD